MTSPRSQKGVALITALLITALATTVAVSLASRQHTDMVRTGNTMESDQAYLYSLGIETLAATLLSQYGAQAEYDDPEVMYAPYTFPVDGGVVSGTLHDQQALLNVNGLIQAAANTDSGYKVNETQELRFKRLLAQVLFDLGEDPGLSETLTNAVIDWIDPDHDVRYPGAEDSDYSSFDPPYAAANRLMASATELQLVKGFTREILYGKKIDDEQVDGLLKYVTALPDSTTDINVNTAPAVLLKALSPHLDDAAVADIIAAREGSPFQKAEDFYNHQAIKSVEESLPEDNENSSERSTFRTDVQSGITVKSRYLLVKANAQVGRSTIVFNSLLFRDGNKVTSVARSIGTNGI